MAPSVAEAVRYLVQQIEELGVHAAADAGELADLPGVLVFPNVVNLDRLDQASITVDLDVVLVASGLPSLAALDQLDELVGQLAEPLGLRELRAVSLNLSSVTAGGDPVPAYQATVSVEVS